ncbi:flagellar export chaperone FlgN [Shimia aestuarii]|uniref:FlgN protein n=1 Tax=Shimia aestuarii TaxID=254406 RepID=A0A1I4K7Y3_9RHOB|nr:flagellar export chaperone FlgN [Shimia aestuarii]SFL74942.1 FlgN protein [Shimia aestuarii]
MSMSATRKIFETLDALLEEERTALIEGNLEALQHLVKRKELLFDKLSKLDGKPESELAALREKTLRNQALLDAALAGIRSVADRIQKLGRVRQSLDTYDENGRRLSVSTVRSKIEKRA